MFEEIAPHLKQNVFSYLGSLHLRFFLFDFVVDFRVPLWARMLIVLLFWVPVLIEFGAIFGREQGKPHNLLGYIPESTSRTLVF